MPAAAGSRSCRATGRRSATLFPPRHAIELYRNVRYFDGNNIAIPIAVLLAYGLVSLVVIVAMTRRADPAPNPRPERRRGAGG